MVPKKEKQTHLTRAELAIMQILWCSERPLCGPEIMAISDKSPNGPAFSHSSYHVLINELLDKGYIVAVSGRGHGRHQARAFAPTVTHNEYHAIQITRADLYTHDDIPDLVDSLIKYSTDLDLEDLKAKLDDVLAHHMNQA